ncbi:MAG TPA: hypothetical protein VF165_23795 [Nocardioidaceae bacterium]
MTESIIPAVDEHLTDGWEPGTPPTDTLVRRAVLVHASWPVEIARALGKPWRRTDDWAGARIGDRGALTNPVVLLRPQANPARVTAEVEEVIPRPVPYMLISPWPTEDLSPAGLVLIGHPPLMARLPAPHEVPVAAGLEVREVNDAEGLAVAERVLVEGYPMPDLEPFSPGDLLAPRILEGTTRVWVGYVDGRPASVAAAHVHADAVLVEYVAALPWARGRGAGAAVTWAATLADESLPAVLVASDDGRPVYERMGYVAVERWTAWLRPHGE